MYSVRYGNRVIEYVIEVNEGVKSHYISVEKGVGVTLKGPAVSADKANALILKKAAWIIEKLELVRSADDENIQTGSRLSYLGRSYYVAVNIDDSLKKVVIEFNHSRFNIFLPSRLNNNSDIKAAFEFFKREKAKEKLTPRINKWVKATGLEFTGLKFTKLQKQWGSCSAKNNITINWDAIQLPWPLIDYLIVHELVHTKIKNHSKDFWAEVSRYIPDFKELDARMGDMKLL